MDDLHARLLLVLGDDARPQSMARIARQLGVEQSRLRRALTDLGDGVDGAGLGLVQQHDDGERTLLSLTAHGRALLTRGVDA